jgi:hypothetical protein
LEPGPPGEKLLPGNNSKDQSSPIAEGAFFDVGGLGASCYETIGTKSIDRPRELLRIDRESILTVNKKQLKPAASLLYYDFLI